MAQVHTKETALKANCRVGKAGRQAGRQAENACSCCEQEAAGPAEAGGSRWDRSSRSFWAR